MRTSLLFLLFCCSFWVKGFSQEVQINEDPMVSQLMTTWTATNRENPRISGWRVQIVSTTDRKQVEEGKTRFRTQYPDIPADWVHEKPYYKLKVGAFLTKAEAMSLISEIKISYPGAYATLDNNIHPREFVE